MSYAAHVWCFKYGKPHMSTHDTEKAQQWIRDHDKARREGPIMFDGEPLNGCPGMHEVRLGDPPPPSHWGTS